MNGESSNYRLAQVKCLLMARPEAPLHALSAPTCPLTPRPVLLLPATPASSRSSYRPLLVFLALPLSSRSPPHFSFLVLRSRYLTPCLHFSSVLLLLLIRLLLSCSLSPLGSRRWRCSLTYFACLRVGELCVCVCVYERSSLNA